MEFDLKWIHMVRYELILRQDEAIWLRIIFKPHLTQEIIINIEKWRARVFGSPQSDLSTATLL